MSNYDRSLHERMIHELAFDGGYGQDLGGEGPRMACADAEYARLMRDADGNLPRGFVWPSEERERANREAMADQTVISTSDADNPEDALRGCSEWPAAVHETESHIDDSAYNGAYDYWKSRWLGFASMQAAVGYVDSVGRSVEIPGPGEETGTWFARKAFENPHYQSPDGSNQ